MDALHWLGLLFAATLALKYLATTCIDACGEAAAALVRAGRRVQAAMTETLDERHPRRPADEA